jgi:mono/diheme cytochrome c family protein
MYSVAVAVLMAGAAPVAQDSDALAAQAAAILRRQCATCHGPGKGARANLNILDHAQLVNKDKDPRIVVPRDPDNSELFQLVQCGSMPPGRAPKVSDEDREVLRKWIVHDAPAFPPRSGEAYVLAQIQADVTGLAANDRPKVRYVSLNHLLDDPDAAKDLDVYRAALAQALNLLSQQKELVLLQPIDAEGTIFRVRLDALGWDGPLYVPDPKATTKDLDPAHVNRFDLVLLEYPYAAPPPDSPAFKALVGSYLKAANLVRLVPYVRGDWLAAAATEAPLYDELLQLPRSVRALEKQLGVKEGTKDKPRGRAGLTESQYLRGNRILERGESDKAVYWRTFDLAGQADLDALVKVAADDPPAHVGEEVLFSLPNGLPAFFVADGEGRRVPGIPERLLKDKEGKGGLPNGRSCLRCHRAGLQPFTDAVHKKLDQDRDKSIKELMYRPLGELSAADNRRLAAPPGVDPLAFVAQRFAANPAGPPPIDSLTVTDTEPAGTPVKVEFAALDGVNPVTQSRPGQMITFRLKNNGAKKVHYELVLSDVVAGTSSVWASGELEAQVEKASTIKIGKDPGKERWVAFVSEEELPPAVPLHVKGEDEPRRVIHPTYRIEGDAVRVLLDPTRVVKKTIVFETLADKK